MVDVVPKTPPELLAYTNLVGVNRVTALAILWDAETQQFRRIPAGHTLDYIVRTAVSVNTTLVQATHQNYLIYSNNGSSPTSITLWSATPGSRVGFKWPVYHPNGKLRIVPPGGNYIGGGGVGKYLEMLSCGEIFLICRATNYWEIERDTCLWNFQP